MYSPPHVRNILKKQFKSMVLLKEDFSDLEESSGAETTIVILYALISWIRCFLKKKLIS